MNSIRNIFCWLANLLARYLLRLSRKCHNKAKPTFSLADCVEFHSELDRQAVGMESVYTIQMQLFGSGPDNVDLLNRSGSNVFSYFESLADQYIVLKLSSLTDKRMVGGRETLSVKRLRYMLRYVQENDDLLTPEFFEQFDVLAADLGQKVSATRRFRHRHVAHIDSEAAHSRLWEPLTNGQIRDAMRALYELLNHVEYTIKGGSKSEYAGLLLPYDSDGNKLLTLLRLADDAK